MGVGVSNWALARAVSSAGQLGVVSSTGIDTVFVRRLQDGDPGRHMRLALAHFPIPDISERILKKYFLEEGRPAGVPYKGTPSGSLNPTQEWEELMMVANFAEVFLAKMGHCYDVGINLLEKIQLPTLPSIYGALLAGVDYVLMGAGIPRAIPGVLDQLSSGAEARLKIDVKGAAPDDNFFSHFDPKRFFADHMPEMKRPRFLGIITSHVLALSLATKSDGHVDGFVVEGPTAGGHNAPPRGPMNLDEKGEPIYGGRDVPDLQKIREIGRPFWMAGSYGTPDGLVRAKEAGAAGIQVGTAFAFCNESGMQGSIKSTIIDSCRRKITRVFTDARASPTGFPFKVFGLEGTMSEEVDYKERKRVCDLGYLRHAFKKEDGTVGYRCPAEPEAHYIKKGGDPADLDGRKCLCNGLMATIGLGQKRRTSSDEKPIVTVGDSVTTTVCEIAGDKSSYSAADVLRYLRSKICTQSAGSVEKEPVAAQRG